MVHVPVGAGATGIGAGIGSGIGDAINGMVPMAGGAA
jgi:hypothetical protein